MVILSRLFLMVVMGFYSLSYSSVVLSDDKTIFSDSLKVQLDSLSFSYQPSAFKIKRAQKLGIPVEIKVEKSVPISGYLTNPSSLQSSASLSPAIVLLHTCAGISKHEGIWAKRLSSWGYVVLTVDSLTPRGQEYICDGRLGSVSAWSRALDAYGAKKYLEDLSYVDMDKIAIMGMSHGGMAVLDAVKSSTSKGISITPFQAGIAFYPICGAVREIDIPTLILVGREDSWTPAGLCEEMLADIDPESDVVLKVYDGAYHLFDHPDIDTEELGFIIRSNPAAALDASESVRTFLTERLEIPIQ